MTGLTSLSKSPFTNIMAANDYYTGSYNLPPHPKAPSTPQHHGPPPPYQAIYDQHQQQQQPMRPSPQPRPQSNQSYHPPSQKHQQQIQAPWQQAYNSPHHPSKHYMTPHSTSYYPQHVSHGSYLNQACISKSDIFSSNSSNTDLLHTHQDLAHHPPSPLPHQITARTTANTANTSLVATARAATPKIHF